mmetsp:Transcript_23372/g.41342  ORF Transcript_23372/g.41342 Transcript_23372/m.41342 type:complete len:140 (+) Transcript_23372:194-613(+)
MGDQVLSSLPLQILLYFNGAFAAFFFVSQLVTYLYKSNNYLYSDGALSSEVFFVFVYAAVEYARLFQASKGNKVEQIGPMIWSLCLGIGVVVIHVFLFEMQTYVLRLDRILNGIGIFFISLESFLSILTSLTFYRDSKF